jgi:hypothetical protein
LAEIVRHTDTPQLLRADMQAFLRKFELTAQDLEAMESVGPERFLMYRKLAHQRIRKVVADFIPRTIARLGASRLDRDVGAFMHERAVESPYLRDVPREFVEWVSLRWEAASEVPNYLVDLARHELVKFVVGNDPAGNEAATGWPVALDRPLRFTRAARRVNYSFAVHELPRAETDRTEPEEVPTRLLVYRDERHEVRYLELTAFAAAVLDRLLVEKRPVQDGLSEACAHLGEMLDDDKLATAATLLADLADRAVMLGAEPRSGC